MTRVNIIAALGHNRAIGYKNDLLARIPDDLKRFKALTTGHPIIMGRKTFESIGKPLPNRTNIVITRNRDWSAEGVVTIESLEKALSEAAAIDGGEIFIIGGGDIYTQALPFADRLYLTLIESDQAGDVFFPPYETLFTKKISEEAHEYEGLPYRFVVLEK
jgi:dihydrofolate reductase